MLSELMNTHFHDDLTSVYVIDKNWIILYHPDKQQIGKSLNDEQIKDVFRNRKSGTAAIPDMRGVPLSLGFDKVNASGWIIVTLSPYHTVIDSLTAIMHSVLYEGAPVMILTLIALTLLAFYIAIPAPARGLRQQNGGAQRH